MAATVNDEMRSTMRIVLPLPNHARATKTCIEPGCDSSTRDKPYCPEHIDRLPYVQQLMAFEERRERESKTLRMSLDSPTVVDVAHCLDAGPATHEALMRACNVDDAAVKAAIRVLGGLVKVGATTRGKKVYSWA